VQSDGYLQCSSDGDKVDLVILIDESGSVGSSRWKKEVSAVSSIVNHLASNDQVAVLRFSRSSNVEWVTQWSNDFATVATNVDGIADSFRSGNTRTDLALDKASVMLTSSRSDALSVVLVITDGVPSYYEATMKAAEALKSKQAKLVWVLLGSYASSMQNKDNFGFSSFPNTDNVILFKRWNVDLPDSVNEVLAGICPRVH